MQNIFIALMAIFCLTDILSYSQINPLSCSQINPLSCSPINPLLKHKIIYRKRQMSIFKLQYMTQVVKILGMAVVGAATIAIIITATGSSILVIDIDDTFEGLYNLLSENGYVASVKGMSTDGTHELSHVPAVKCPLCLNRGTTTWVIPGKNCPKCGTVCG